MILILAIQIIVKLANIFLLVIDYMEMTFKLAIQIIFKLANVVV